MKYGKIRIEEGIIHFSSRMITNSVPTSDVGWAYHRRGPASQENSGRTLVTNLLVLVTTHGKRFEVPMSEKEISDCLQTLKTLNPSMVTGFPSGSRLLLQTLPNTRDLGALETQDGKNILPGKLFRSSELYHLSSSDQEDLVNVRQLHTVIDLRAPKEREARPDDVLKDVTYYNCSLLDFDSDFIFDELSLMDQIGTLEGDPKEYLTRQYVNMIKDPFTVGQLARVIEIIRQNKNGAILWHCSIGKDRTDLVTAILLEILGVPREAILKDFMKSNLYLALEKEYAIELMVANGFARANVEPKVNALFQVEERYLTSIFDTIDEVYGSMHRFFRRALYLNQKTIDDLKEKYLI